MRFLLVVPGVALVAIVAQATPGANFDFGTALVAYGVAAPFAGICVWGWLRAERRAERAERSRDEALQARIDDQRRVNDILSSMTPMLRNVASSLPEAIAGVDAVHRREADPMIEAVARLERAIDDIKRQ